MGEEHRFALVTGAAEEIFFDPELTNHLTAAISSNPIR